MELFVSFDTNVGSLKVEERVLPLFELRFDETRRGAKGKDEAKAG
jgi:hypothetical protein